MVHSTLPDLQQTVATFVADHQLPTGVEARLLDLVSEVGELAKENLTASQYGRQPFAPTSDWAAELGDVAFSLICLANTTNVDLNDALNAALEKYRQRLSQTGNAGSRV